MSYTVVPRADVLTHYGVQQPSTVEFSGPIDRVDSVSAELLRGRVALSIVNHPPAAAQPNAANVDLSAASVRHLIRRLDTLASALEADGK